jgi:H+/Cl- antiporter ClcA
MFRRLITTFKAPYIIIKQLLRWTALIVPIAFLIGTIIALFLSLLQAAIQFRFQHKWLLFLLPFAGLLIHFIYKTIGKSSEKGNNLIMEEIHQAGAGVPKRMAPVIFVTTIITHLFGGSAGREGTAVQIGGSIAGMYGKWLKLKAVDMRMILIAGVAAGFGAVFGTPLTGAIFALEVLTIGKIKYDALFPALIAALVGDVAVSAWHVTHVQYKIDLMPEQDHFLSNYLHLDLLLLSKILISSAIFGLTSFVFSTVVYEIKTVCLLVFKRTWMIPVFGGFTIIALTMLLGKSDYLSLGVNAEHPGAVTISSAFHAAGSDTWSWLWKMVYTGITLGTGFKGGEVTPLFYIGATLGNTLSGILNAPASLFAALGFIAVFAGATNTPLACTFMGIELFGGEHALFFAVACFTSYLCSGHSGIYSSQRISVPKILNEHFKNDHTVADAVKRRGYFYEKLKKYQLPSWNKD